MEITKSNVGELGFEYLKSKINYKKDLSSYTERLIENEINARQQEMDKYLFSGFNNLSSDELLLIKSKSNRYSFEFDNQITEVLFNRNQSRNINSKTKSYINKGSKSRVGIVIMVFIGIIAVITNPSTEKHKDEIKEKCYSLMHNKINESTNESSGNWKFAGQALGMLIGNNVIDIFVGSTVSSDNYVFFSTTKIFLNGDTKIIGIGVFGNIFLGSGIDKALNDALYNNNQKNFEYK